MSDTPNGYVWHSDARNPMHTLGFTCALAEDWEAYLDHLQLYRRGEIAARPNLPDRMWIGRDASRSSKALKTLPETFVADSYFVVSQNVAEVLQGFDLGTSSLVPVALFKKRGTRSRSMDLIASPI
jgi:hypothetical protein